MNLSAAEENAVSQLRDAMRNDLPSEMYEDPILLYKFLKARNFSIAQAEAMLRKHLRWRKEMQINTILTDFKGNEAVVKYLSQNMIGFDKEGCPVWYDNIGNTDTIGIFKSCNHRNILKYVIQTIELNHSLFKSQSKKLGIPVNEIVCVYDMANLTLAKATHSKSIQIFRDGLNIFQDNYPEHMKSFYFINASVYFTFIFPVIKSVLASAVLSKIQVFGKDGWREELLKCIDADVLPAFLGGTRTDPDGNPNCIMTINHGGIVPESYYLVKSIEKFIKNDNTCYVRIDRQGSFQVPVCIEEPMSIICWEFGLKNYDIGFGLLLDSPNQTNCELIPIHRIETEIDPESGMFRCETFGTYKIVFDNSHSWLYSKDLYYRIWVTSDTEDMQN